MVNDTFCSDTELNSYIQQSAYELYDLITEAYGTDYNVTVSSTVTTDGTNDTYSLASDFYKLLGVDLRLTASPTGYITLRPFAFIERNRWALPNYQSFFGATNLQYRLRGSKLWLAPMPAAGQVLRYFYIPTMTALSGDSVELQTDLSGWSEYVVVDAAIKAMAKEESDVSVLMARKQALIQRLNSVTQNRDAGSPARVADSQYSSLGWWGVDGNNDGWW